MVSEPTQPNGRMGSAAERARPLIKRDHRVTHPRRGPRPADALTEATAPAAGGASRIELNPAEFRTRAEFRYLIREFLFTSGNLAARYGITPQQYQLLLTIEGRPDDQLPTIGYIAERLLIQHHSAVGLVDRLVDQNLVHREHNVRDRRQVLVTLTSEGEAVLAAIAAGSLQELRSVGPRLVEALGYLIASNP